MVVPGGRTATVPKPSTGFVLDPRCEVVVSLSSDGAVGRLATDDVIGLLRHLREQAAASS